MRENNRRPDANDLASAKIIPRHWNIFRARRITLSRFGTISSRSRVPRKNVRFFRARPRIPLCMPKCTRELLYNISFREITRRYISDIYCCLQTIRAFCAAHSFDVRFFFLRHIPIYPIPKNAPSCTNFTWKM